MSPDVDFVSVIIPVYNDEERLRTALEALSRQTYPANRFEVIVVDNGSEAPPAGALELLPSARIEQESRPGSYAARNRGLEVARGDVLAFTDADCIPSPEWLEEGVKALREIELDGLVAGEIRLRLQRAGRPNAVECYDLVTGFNEPNPGVVFAYTANAFTHKRVFEKVGPFNTELLSGGDYEWSQRIPRAGLPFRYSREAYIEHPSRRRLSEITAKERRLAGGKVQMIEDATWTLDGEKKITKMPWWLKVVPNISEIRRQSRDPRLQSSWQRLRFAVMAIFIYYVRGVERVRIALGGSPERR